MALFEDITVLAASAVKKGSKKAKDTGKIVALKYNNYTARNDIDKLYAKIGKYYYEKHGLSPEAGLEKLCDRVTELLSVINDNDAAVNEIRIDGVLDEVVVDPDEGE